jgi:hypothetical protein
MSSDPLPNQSEESNINGPELPIEFGPPSLVFSSSTCDLILTPVPVLPVVPARLQHHENSKELLRE